MNSTRISKLILSLLFLCLATTGRAQTFPRLLLGGDYPTRPSSGKEKTST